MKKSPLNGFGPVLPKTKIIKSPEDFWELMSASLAEDHPDISKLNIKFEGWPQLFIKVDGEKFKASLTGSMISGMALMNESFHRAYAMAKYGTPNLQRLTGEDKQALDVVYKIDEGSTESCTDWACTANNAITFLQTTMDGMSGIEKMAVLLALITAITFGGCYYLSRKSKDKQSDRESSSSDIKAVILGMKDAFEIAVEVKKQGETPASREIENYGINAKTALLKSVANDADSAVVGGEKYTSAQLLDFKNRQSVQRESRESFDNFYILGIQRSGLSTEFNMQVSRQTNGESFNIKISEEMTRPGELQKLAGAILTKEVIRLSYLEVKENGVVARGQFNLILEKEPPAARA